MSKLCVAKVLSQSSRRPLSTGTSPSHLRYISTLPTSSNFTTNRYSNTLNPVRLKTNALLPTFDLSKNDSNADGSLSLHSIPQQRDARSSDSHPAHRSKQPHNASPRVHSQKRPSMNQIHWAAKTQAKHTHIIDIRQDHITLEGCADLPVSFSHLRDECTCTLCIDPSTRQRTHTSGQAHLAAMSGTPVFCQTANGYNVDWADGHQSTFTSTQLRDIALGDTPEELGRRRFPSRTRWATSEELRAAPGLCVPYAELGTEAGLWRALNQAHVFGLVIVRGVPTERTGDRDCELRRVAARIGEIRDTFYGQTWDVKSMPNSKNVAYTDVDLGPHMDLLYFSEPPRFQLLHCLRNRVHGGLSYFIDSFAAASLLQSSDFAAFRLLQQVRMRFVYDNDGHFLDTFKSVIPHSLYSLRSAVNWSPPFQGASYTIHSLDASGDERGMLHSKARAYYDALQAWETILADPAMKLEFKLDEGDLIIFDNRRVLHARTSFRDWTEAERVENGVQLIPGEPTRWLKGCYIDGDAVWDRLRGLIREFGGGESPIDSLQ